MKIKINIEIDMSVSEFMKLDKSKVANTIEGVTERKISEELTNIRKDQKNKSNDIENKLKDGFKSFGLYPNTFDDISIRDMIKNYSPEKVFLTLQALDGNVIRLLAGDIIINTYKKPEASEDDDAVDIWL